MEDLTARIGEAVMSLGLVLVVLLCGFALYQGATLGIESGFYLGAARAWVWLAGLVVVVAMVREIFSRAIDGEKPSLRRLAWRVLRGMRCFLVVAVAVVALWTLLSGGNILLARGRAFIDVAVKDASMIASLEEKVAVLADANAALEAQVAALLRENENLRTTVRKASAAGVAPSNFGLPPR